MRNQEALLLRRAERVARAAHAGQTDKAGSDYFASHVADVAARVARAGYGPEAQAVAFLHDVLEDTAVTEAELRKQFPEEVVTAVVALTRSAGESSDSYYARVRANELALAVKVYGDVPSNTNPERLALLDPATQARLKRKYAHALSVLTRNEEEE
jgi:(p)ppGpp synthase/HD superfamily hydrolase